MSPESQEAVKAERARCLRIVAHAQPDITKYSGFELQTWNGHEWIKAAKRAISKAIAAADSPEEKAADRAHLPYDAMGDYSEKKGQE